MKHLLTLILAMLQFCNIYGQNIDVFRFKTKFDHNVIYQNYGGKRPAYIVVNEKIVFQTQQNKRGEYENFMWAGAPYSWNSTQEQRSGGKTICMRWVIETGWPKTHYIIDFTEIIPVVVGPFRFTDDSDEVQDVFWGKRYALIKFKSLRRFKYYYKEKEVIED